ncbi:MAG: hypothetical protein PHX21_08265 [bacterium]|nr:hypothetical protein [bacterium]
MNKLISLCLFVLLTGCYHPIKNSVVKIPILTRTTAQASQGKLKGGITFGTSDKGEESYDSPSFIGLDGDFSIFLQTGTRIVSVEANYSSLGPGAIIDFYPINTPPITIALSLRGYFAYDKLIPYYSAYLITTNTDFSAYIGAGYIPKTYSLLSSSYYDNTEHKEHSISKKEEASACVLGFWFDFNKMKNIGFICGFEYFPFIEGTAFSYTGYYTEPIEVNQRNTAVRLTVGTYVNFKETF